MADDEGGGGDDPRIAVLMQYTLKTMKLKNDKWAKVRTICSYCTWYLIILGFL